ncbi:hypothetical protein [Candidatus Bandiella numerosa]|uniref:hypothetical protein n=1 Tax=Candidatus Bandiella numerosa TaxID=2570586 RepID=UPI001F245062|nr:hypothetical protein [Candidatus Bandiella numerosa]
MRSFNQEITIKGRCINAKQGRYAINGFKKLDSYKEEALLNKYSVKEEMDVHR